MSPQSSGRNRGGSFVSEEMGLLDGNKASSSNPPSSSGCSTQDTSNKCGELRYTRFAIRNVTGEKHAVFVPESTQLTPATLAQVCNALGRDVPSCLLQGVGSLRHPARMSTPQLRRCAALGQVMTDSKKTAGLLEDSTFCTCGRPRTLGPEGELRLGGSQEIEDQALVVDAADGVLEKRIAATVSGVAKAAARENVWTLSWPRITSFELFLQQCIESGETDVFRMVVAHVQDRSYMESAHSTRLLKHLFRCSEYLSSETVDKARVVSLQGDLWDRARNAANPEFAEHGYDHWSFDSYDDPRVTGHPLTQWPWPYADLFFLFYREEATPSIHLTVAEPDWSFKTTERLDRDAIPFSPDVLAPTGHIFIGGGSELHMKKRMLHALQATCPVLLFNNTPNLPKQMSILVNLIKRAWEPSPARALAPFLRDGWRGGGSSAELLQEIVPSRLLKHVESEFDNSGMEADEYLSLSDVVGVLDIARRRGQNFRETVCVIDPLQDSLDRTCLQLSTALASHYSSGRHAGAATASGGSLVLQGWRLHHTLAQIAEKLHRRSTATVVAVATLLFVAAMLAVFMVSLGLEKAAADARIRAGGQEEIAAPLPHAVLRIDFDAWDLCVLRVAVLALPVTAGFLVALQSRHQTAQKWASAHTAASQVVAELYYFLGNVGPYRAGAAAANQRRLLRRLQDIRRQPSLAGIQDEHLLGQAGAERLQDEDFPRDSEELQQHVKRSLYGRRRPGYYSSHHVKVLDIEETLGPSATGHHIASGASAPLVQQEPKDFTVPLNAEMYMETRFTLLREHYNGLSEHLSIVSMLLHALSLVCLALVAGLGFNGLSLWIPIPLGLATLVMSLSSWFAPPETLSALNDALVSLDLIDVRWKQSDAREHRAEATKQRLITLTERLSLHVDTVWSRATAMLEDDELEEDIDGRLDAPAKDEASRSWRSRPIYLAGRIGTHLASSGSYTPVSDAPL